MILDKIKALGLNHYNTKLRDFVRKQYNLMAVIRAADADRSKSSKPPGETQEEPGIAAAQIAELLKQIEGIGQRLDRMESDSAKAPRQHPHQHSG